MEKIQYEELVAHRAEMQAAWEELGSPYLSAGHGGQLVEHPLAKSLRAQDGLIAKAAAAVRVQEARNAKAAATAQPPHPGPKPGARLSTEEFGLCLAEAGITKSPAAKLREAATARLQQGHVPAAGSQASPAEMTTPNSRRQHERQQAQRPGSPSPHRQAGAVRPASGGSGDSGRLGEIRVTPERPEPERDPQPAADKSPATLKDPFPRWDPRPKGWETDTLEENP